VPVNGSQVIRKLSQDFLYHSFSWTQRYQALHDNMKRIADFRLVDENRYKILSDDCDNQVHFEIV
jgi:hypothetical protein